MIKYCKQIGLILDLVKDFRRSQRYVLLPFGNRVFVDVLFSLDLDLRQREVSVLCVVVISPLLMMNGWYQFYTCLTCFKTRTPSWIGKGSPANETRSLGSVKPTNFIRVVSRNWSISFWRTFGVHGNAKRKEGFLKFPGAYVFYLVDETFSWNWCRRSWTWWLWNFSWFFHSSALFYVPQLIIGLIITV